MQLTELHPAFMGAGGEGISTPGPDPCPQCAGAGCDDCHHTGKQYVPAPERHGVGVRLDCPCGNRDKGHQLYVPFANPLDGGPPMQTGKNNGWQRTGETFETLTLTPSILRRGSCGWHGFITNGEIVTV
jgi:hypothetical protein